MTIVFLDPRIRGFFIGWSEQSFDVARFSPPDGHAADGDL
jgi:hypothetical protein